MKKDPGIPNLFPYKEKLLEQIEENKRLKEEEILRKKAEAKAQRTGVKEQDVHVGADAMEEDVLVDDEDMVADDDIGSVSTGCFESVVRNPNFFIVWCKPNGRTSGLCKSPRRRVPRGGRGGRNGGRWRW